MYNYKAAMQSDKSVRNGVNNSDFIDIDIDDQVNSNNTQKITILKKAYETEIEKLKEALHLALDNSNNVAGSSGGGGSVSDILEGKFLLQLKQNRNLNVLLETEKNKARQLQEEKKALELEVQKLTARGNNNNSKGRSPAGNRRPPSKGPGSEDHKSAGAPGQNEEQLQDGEVDEGDIKSLHAKLVKLQQTVREKDLHIENYKRDVKYLKEVIVKEVGQDVVQSQDLFNNNNNGNGNNNSSWKGRSEQLALLRSKLKEQERQLKEVNEQKAKLLSRLQCVSEENQHSNPFNDTGLDDVESLMALAHKANHTISNANNSNNTKDFEEETRDHLTELSHKKGQQAQQLEAALTASREQVRELEQRCKAQQARMTTLTSLNNQLKGNVALLLGKSESDDELLRIYKENVERLQGENLNLGEELRELREEQWGPETNGRRTSVLSSHSNSSDRRRSSLATAAALQHVLAGGEQQGSVLPSPLPCRKERPQIASLADWIFEALLGSASEEGYDEEDEERQLTEAHLSALLHTAHNHVMQSEDYTQFVLFTLTKAAFESYQNVSRKLQQFRSAINKGNANNTNNLDYSELIHAIDAVKPLENFLLDDNSSLKKRVKSLSELLDRENKAFTSLNQQLKKELQTKCTTAATTNVTSAGAVLNEGNQESEGEYAKLQEDYAKLQKQYNDLRKAFNQMQQRNM